MSDWPADEKAQVWLDAFLREEGGAAGSVHLQRDGDLILVAARNLPSPVIAAVRHVPHGKGMAGAAQVRRAPVQTCDLKAGSSVVKPGAKAVDAQAAIALPVLDDAGEVHAVVGIAWTQAGDIPRQREAALMTRASRLRTEG